MPLTAGGTEAFGLSAADIMLMAGPATGGGLLTAWLLEEDGVAVSCAVTGLVEQTLSVWAMSTPARLSRRGYGRAVLDSVLAAGVIDGATTGVLGATPAGRPLYLATGWRDVEEWDVFCNAESLHFSAPDSGGQ